MVNSDEFREQMGAFMKEALHNATVAKMPNLAVEELRTLYLSLSTQEQDIARTLMQDWLVSTNEYLRRVTFGVVALLELRDLVPALRELLIKLSVSDTPGDKDERDTVMRVVATLTGGRTASQDL